jgi:heat shock protein HslJ
MEGRPVPDDAHAPSTPSDAPVGSWILERLRNADGSLGHPVPGARPEIRFAPDGAVTGTTGCNSFRGSYRTDAGSIAVQPPATTRRFCLRPPGVMEQESLFLDAITAASAFTVDEHGTLVLSNGAGDPLMEMSRQEPDGT